MTLSEIETYSRHMAQTAERILETSGVLTMLQQYCTPHLTGSYALDLMYGPDIDIVAVTDHPQEVSRIMLNTMVEQGFFQRYEYGDFVRFASPNRPKGYILVLAITTEHHYWEIEMWFLTHVPSKETALMQSVRTSLTPESRRLILALKHQREQAGVSKHTLSSATIYTQVLHNGISTFEELMASLT